MDNPREHIDQFLSEVLTDAQMSADGIDWDAFQNKRNKKRVLLWWVVSAATIFIISSVWFTLTLTQPDPQVATPTNQAKGLKPQKGAEIDDSSDALSSMPNSKNRNPVSQTTVAKSTRLSQGYEKTGQKVDQSPIRLAKESDKLPSRLRLFMKPREFSGFNKDESSRLAPLPTAVQLNDVGLEEVEEVQTFVKLGVGPTLVNPNLSITTKGKSLIHKDYVDIRNGAENSAVGFYLSGAIGKKFNKISPHIGLGFSYNSVFAKYNFEYTERPIQDLNGTIIGYQQRAAERIAFNSNQSYSLLNIPIGVEYNLRSNEKSSWNLVGEFAPQILVSISGNLPNAVLLNQKDLLTTTDYKLNALTGQVGFNYTSELRNMEWYIEPKFGHNFGINQVNGMHQTRFNMIVVTFGLKKYDG